MITVVETRNFERAARRLLAQDRLADVIGLIAANPVIGDLVPETGGIRKLRIALEGRGKSGGARVIYYFHSETMPVFLLDLFAKSEKENLSKAERNALAKLVRGIKEAYGV